MDVTSALRAPVRLQRQGPGRADPNQLRMPFGLPLLIFPLATVAR
jgi:hypothetical protein